MNRSKSLLPAVILLSVLLSYCKSDEPRLQFEFAFDETQQRLDNFGQAAVIPAGHAAQTPVFSKIGANYIEFAPDSLTWLGQGDIVFESVQTTSGGDTAIDFDLLPIAGEGETFLDIPLSDLSPGTYRWLRVSLAYQEYDINMRAVGFTIPGTIASFVGYNSYIRSFDVGDTSIVINGNRLQGFGAVHTDYGTVSWQAPPGATTVPNPIALTSPVPAGSCVVTGRFDPPLVITGNEKEDMRVTMSVSINQSFEWVDNDANGTFDVLDGDSVVDMGLRGLVPSWE